MEKIFCVVFLAFLILPVASLAQEIPTLTKYVNDYAGVLSGSERAQINDLCAQIEQNSTVEIAVLTVNSTQPLSIDQYAVQVFEKNGIGKKDTNNGLLIVAAIDDRKWRFEVGYGLEPIINDAKAGRIGRAYLVLNFQNEEYGQGLYQAVEAVGQVIANNGDDSFISTQTGNFTVTVFVITAVFIVLASILPIIVILGIFSSEKCPNCGSRMNCTYEGDTKVCVCPKCGKKVRKKTKSNFWFFVGGLGAGRGFGGSGGGGGGGFGGGSSGGGGASGGW
jgi:uncharacterized protein